MKPKSDAPNGKPFNIDHLNFGKDLPNHLRIGKLKNILSKP